MEILDLAVSLRDSLPDSGRSCQHTVWWCGCGGRDVGVQVCGRGDVGGVYGGVDVLGCGCVGVWMWWCRYVCEVYGCVWVVLGNVGVFNVMCVCVCV